MRRETRLRIDYKPEPTTATAKSRPRWFIPVLLLPLLGGVLAYALNRPAGTEPEIVESATEALAPESAEPVEPAATEPPGEKVDLVVRRNDTLERLFRRLRLNLDDLTAILDLPGVRQALNRIRPGDKVTVVHEDGTVHALNRRLSETEMLTVRRADDGFAAEIVTTPIEVRTTHAYGTIDSSLFVAARAAGVRPETIMQLANDIFGWQIDFALDIRPGDRFHLVYEQKYRDDKYIGDGRILAAEFVNAGEVHRAVHYVSDDGRIDGYFTPEGRSMRLQFLRAPLDFRRVSSNFNPRRRHPILNRIRAHQGVDYSASPGTVIKAAGDGRVRFIGTKGGYGKTVILEHGGGITTLYAHMSGFARGMRHGVRVRQGQTIGYVGSSGAATGPHLHYEYRVNGVHKNPRTVRLPDAAPIPAQYKPDFALKTELVLAALDEARATTLATAPEAEDSLTQ